MSNHSWRRRAQARVIGLVDAAVVAERVDEEVEGGLIAEADGRGGGFERADGVVDEVGGGEAVEEGAERGAEEGRVPPRGVVVGEEEGGGERELEVLAEDVDGAGERAGGRGQVGAGGRGGPVEEVERAAPVVGVEGQRLEHRRCVESGGLRGGGGGGGRLEGGEGEGERAAAAADEGEHLRSRDGSRFASYGAVTRDGRSAGTVALKMDAAFA
nr:unnamed protein product [Digitaria exilis]